MAETHTQPHVQTVEHSGVSWIDVQNPDRAAFARLERDYHLHPIHLQESVQKVQHTEVDREEQYLFLVLRVPVFRARPGKIDVKQIGVFLGKDYLVTIHEGENPVTADMLGQIHGSAETREECFRQGSGYVLYELVNMLLQVISGMTESVVSELDTIEDMVFDSTRSDASKIGQLRQRIVKLRGIIGPKRLVLEDLEEQVSTFAGHGMTKYYSTNTKTVNRLWEVISEAKDTVEIYKDADFTASTERTNKTLAVLTLIFTFTIPVTVLGTVYGMNILLPGSVNGHPWTFLGSYTTFGLAIGLSVLAALGMYLWFRKKRWL